MNTRHGFRRSSWLLLASVLAVPAWAQSGPKGQDFAGVWMASGEGRMNSDPSLQSQWTHERLPFTPAGEKVFLANKPGMGPRAVKPADVNDPQNEANPHGLYRLLRYSRPMEIMQVPGKIVQLFGWGRVFRTIYVDGRPVPDDVPQGPFWYGYSVGHWEGDTLVVTTLALDGRAWLDEWGTPTSDDAKVEERWQRIAPNKLQMTITIRDSTFYTRPWTADPVVFNLRKEEPMEIILAPVDEQFFDQRLLTPASTPAP